MSDVVIRARNVRKVFKLYDRPRDKVFGLFGLQLGSAHDHVALDDINLTIRRGERVAIIGRNGAGKSTLLRLISGVAYPTHGEIEVSGRRQVLMQIGSGFHPDLTGRQNVRSYLAQMGVAGKAADKAVREVEDFAEIGEYFDQPLRTYSSGMGARVMFAASTVIEPDILILDEILSVGDAYFTHKSFERIRSLCATSGTTLILVSHNVYGAAQLCNRMVWLDGGRILADDIPATVIAGYEASVKEQEERQLRMGALLGADSAADEAALFGEIRVKEGALRGALFLSSLRFKLDNGAELVMDCARNSRGYTVLEGKGKGSWSDVLTHDGIDSRQFLPYGSVFSKLPFIIRAKRGFADELLKRSLLEMTHWSDVPCTLTVCMFGEDGKKAGDFEVALQGSKQWEIAETALGAVDGGRVTGTVEVAPNAATVPEGQNRFGTRRIEVNEIEVLDGRGRSRLHFTTGSDISIRMKYEVKDPTVDEHPCFLVAFHQDGVRCTHRFWTDQLAISARDNPSGTIEVMASPLLLGPGDYTITVAVFQEGHITSPGRKPFFAVSPYIYDMHARFETIRVLERLETPLYSDYVFQHPCSWSLDGAAPIDGSLRRCPELADADIVSAEILA